MAEALYDPQRPNSYQQAKYALYRRQRARQEESESVARSSQTTGPASQSSVGADDGSNTVSSLANALSAFPSTGSLEMSVFTASPLPSATVLGGALSEALTSSSTSSPFTGVDPVPSGALSMTAEELHLQRVKRSAAMGIQRAVDMEREALELEHKKRKLEGADTKSRIGGLLERMKKKKEAQTQPSASAASSSSSSSSAQTEGGSAERTSSQEPGFSLTTTTTTVQGGTNTTSPPPSSLPSAPLVFKPSGLAAGGYVMAPAHSGGDTTAPSSAAAALERKRRALKGKPSSTLLLRLIHSHTTTVSPSEVTPCAPPALVQLLASACVTAEGGEGDDDSRSSPLLLAGGGPAVDTPLAPLLEDIRAECGRHGVVRGTRAYIMTAEEEEEQKEKGEERRSASVAASSAAAEPLLALQRRLRVLVRFNTVADAFKAAEALAVLPQLPWSITFFPTSRYDAGQLGPTEGEPRVVE